MTLPSASLPALLSGVAPTSLNSVYQPPGSVPLPPTLNGHQQGLCSLAWQDQVFTFRTNPNEMWWSYELIKAPFSTYGGTVTQILGVRMGDLRVKIDCGAGGWPYLMQVVSFLRNLLTDQRNGNAAVFTYAPRNWKLGVYSLTIPFEDQVEATVREIELNFKIQEDISGNLGQNLINAEILALQQNVYGVTQATHNSYNDGAGGKGLGLAREAPGGPTYAQNGPTNTVDSTGIAGNLSQGVASNIPGLSTIASALGF